jgi:hypothetical protein
VDFREADRRYTDLKRRYDNGDLSDEEFRTQLEQTVVQDAEGRWWLKHRDTGAWHYSLDGSKWVQCNPPHSEYEPTTTPPQSPPAQEQQPSDQEQSRGEYDDGQRGAGGEDTILEPTIVESPGESVIGDGPQPDADKEEPVVVPPTPPPNYWRLILGLATALVLIGVAAWFLFVTNTRAPNHLANPPHLTGKTLGKAREIAGDEGYTIVSRNSNLPNQTVSTQDPLPDESIKAGGRIIVTTIDCKNEQCVGPVPDLRGLSQSAADEKLEMSGLELGEVIKEASDEQAAGKIISHYPPRESWWNKDGYVNVHVSTGS